MRHLISILFGASFTIIACWSAGKLLLSRLQLELFAGELQLFRFATGAALFSLLVLLLASVNMAKDWVFLSTGAALIVPAVWVRQKCARLPAIPLHWKLLFTAIFLIFGVYYLVNALAPEISPDGSEYHLGLVSRYFRQHGLGHITTSIYASLSEGLEMLFLVAFASGRHSAATLVEFAFLALLPFAMTAYGQRFGMPRVGIAAGLIVFCSPVFGISGTSAYNDVAAAFTLFCTFYALRIWDTTRQPRLLVVVGLLAGFCYGIKYTLALAVVYCLGFIAWKLRRKAWKPMMIVTTCAGLMIAPWWIKNWVTVDNPISPFGNKIFANKYVTPRFEYDYVKMESSEVPWKNRPLEHTIYGGSSSGLLGAIFLLAPLALLALRYREGRLLLLTTVVFFLPCLANVQTRFLMLCAPFVALAMSMAVMQTRGALYAITIAAAFFSWPTVVSTYCTSWAWRLNQFPLADALRIIPESQSLTRRLGSYATAMMIDEKTPAEARIFTGSSPSTAYIDREIIVGYQSAYGMTAEDILDVPLQSGWAPTLMLSFEFPHHAVRRLRVVQTANGRPEDEWSVAEMRLFDGPAEVPRQPQWKVRATPNPWDVDFAFDNNPATRWRARRELYRGMNIEMDLGRPVDLTAVRIQCSHDQTPIRLQLEVEDSPGHWAILSTAPKSEDRAITGNLRRAAMGEVKAMGITHVLYNRADYGWDDVLRNPEVWGVSLVGSAGTSRLYVIN